MESKVKFIQLTVFIVLAQWLFTSDIYADRFYRYKDENGKIVVSSTLPPKYAQKGYEILNAQSMVIEVVEPRKTKEQLEAERLEQKRLAAEAEKQRQQEQLDAILINSYSDISDVERARENELVSKNRDISFLNQNIRRLTRLLEDSQTLAARDERLGKEISPKLLKDIDDFKARIAKEKAQIVTTEAEKVRIIERYNSSMTRFAELKAAERLKAYKLEAQDELNAQSIFECEGLNTCDLAWTQALRFASEYSTVELAWANDTTIMMRKPQKDDDISIVVTRVNNSRGTAASIVLEVRCTKTLRGEQFCQSSEVRGIHENFKSYLRLPSSKA